MHLSPALRRRITNQLPLRAVNANTPPVKTPAPLLRPAHHQQPRPAPMSDEARNQQQIIMDHSQLVRRYRDGSRPQLGWDERTGTPLFSVRATATNSYTALSGPNQRYVERLHQQWRNIFRLEYIRIQREGQTVYTLAWPEFVDNQCARHQNPSVMAALQELRTFSQ